MECRVLRDMVIRWRGCGFTGLTYEDALPDCRVSLSERDGRKLVNIYQDRMTHEVETWTFEYVGDRRFHWTYGVNVWAGYLGIDERDDTVRAVIQMPVGTALKYRTGANNWRQLRATPSGIVSEPVGRCSLVWNSLDGGIMDEQRWPTHSTSD